MASTIKTTVSNASVAQFIAAIEDEQKRKDAKALLALFKKVTGEKAKMWGTSMIGFGQYHYKSDRSAQEGDWPLVAFSPRKANLTLYIMPGFKGVAPLLKKLGKHKISGGSCLYIKRLSDVDMTVLESVIEQGYFEMKKKHGV